MDSGKDDRSMAYNSPQGSSAVGFLYLIIGLVMAYKYSYLVGLTDIGNLLSALLAILVWPLLLFGVDLRINL